MQTKVRQQALKSVLTLERTFPGDRRQWLVVLPWMSMPARLDGPSGRFQIIDGEAFCTSKDFEVPGPSDRAVACHALSCR